MYRLTLSYKSLSSGTTQDSLDNSCPGTVKEGEFKDGPVLVIDRAAFNSYRPAVKEGFGDSGNSADVTG